MKINESRTATNDHERSASRQDTNQNLKQNEDLEQIIKMPKVDVIHSNFHEERSDIAPNAGPQFNIHKKIVRTAQEDAFFKTGVDVVETEEYEFEGSAADAANAFKAG